MWNFWKKKWKKKLQKNKKFDLSRENKIFFLKFKCPWGVRKLSVSKKWTFFFALRIASVYGLPPHGTFWKYFFVILTRKEGIKKHFCPFWGSEVSFCSIVKNQRSNRGSHAVRAGSARIGARGIRADPPAFRGSSCGSQFYSTKTYQTFCCQIHIKSS